MFKVLTIAATALTGLALSSGAVAKETPAAAPTAAADQAAAQPDTKERKYCVVDTLTGSRMPTKVCKTRKVWMAEGFDPLNP